MTLSSNVLRLHPDNPHYYLYRGAPTVLITSAEHYGAVINRAFDYDRYLRTLHAYDLNYTRIYPGTLLEAENKWLAGNTLGPRPDDTLLPWARVAEPGAQGLCDLDRWDEAYFTRLHAFMRLAEELGIIVQVCLFNAQYEDTWPLSPLYHRNNIQGEADCPHQDAQTLRCPELTRRYDDYIRKLVRELNPYSNLVWEICDEPLITGTPATEAVQWIQHELDVITDEERTLPNRHLIAQQIEGLVDFSANAGIQVLVAQYVWGPDDGQMGGMRALTEKYAADKAIDLNETNYFPLWYQGDAAAAARVEAWEFIVGGGSSYNHLNGDYTCANPAGDTPATRRVLTSLQALRRFMAGLDFVNMRPDRSCIIGGVPAGAICRCISDRGWQYAIYIHHSQYDNPVWKMAYRVCPGDYELALALALPRGEYVVEWVEPETGRELARERCRSHGAACVLRSPRYTVDIACRVSLSDSGRLR